MLISLKTSFEKHAPRHLQRHPKTVERRLQGDPRHLKTPQDCSKVAQDTPKTLPRRPQDAPRPPKMPPRRPRHFKDVPINFQEPQDTCKRPPTFHFYTKNQKCLFRSRHLSKNAPQDISKDIPKRSKDASKTPPRRFRRLQIV